MVWGYNSDTGAVQEAPSWAAWFSFHSGTGWHGPFNTKQDALNYYEANKGSNPGWKAPSGLGSNIVNDTTSTLGQATQVITDPFKGINLGAWVLRIGEILLGIVLVGVGVAELTGTTNAISSLAKNVKVIPV